jgi:hypothetical protein
MPGDYPSCEDHAVPDHAAPGNASPAPTGRGARPSLPWPIHEVVDLVPAMWSADRRAIDRGVGADLDIVLDDDVRPLGIFACHRLPGEPNPSLPSTAPSRTITR